jgi:hypothetical protein
MRIALKTKRRRIRALARLMIGGEFYNQWLFRIPMTFVCFRGGKERTLEFEATTSVFD